MADTLEQLVDSMNKLSGDHLLDLDEIASIVKARDNEVDNPYSKDAQTIGIQNSRRYLGDKLFPHGKTAQDPGYETWSADSGQTMGRYSQDSRRDPD